MRRAAVIALAAAVAAVASSAQAAPGLPSAAPMPATRLDTGVVDPEAFTGASATAAFARVRESGGSLARLVLFWALVAPAGETRPPSFDAANHLDPLYRWESFDRQVSAATNSGLQPIVTIQLAPAWAETTAVGIPGTRLPSHQELALFARAAASRYSGTVAGLPHVRHWQVWNEPNLDWFLTPQFERGVPVSPRWYAGMVNEFAAAVKSVRNDNLVVAGGTSPFGAPNRAVAPLRFMRDLLCISKAGKPRRDCTGPRVRFDIWSHHPYSMSGAFRQAALPDNASLGDLPEMRQLLAAAVRAGRILSDRPVEFWVTEFSWDTSPPDPHGVPIQLHARWVSEALFQMWRSGVSAVVWFRLSDEPMSVGSFQSGLHFDDGAGTFTRPKPAWRAFRFPFVAYRSGRTIRVWGRSPVGRSELVTVEMQRQNGSWRRVTRFRTNRFGIFDRRFSSSGNGSLRARSASGTSLAFSQRRPRDITLENPFGR